MRRRHYLTTLAAAGITGVAGCSSSPEDTEATTTTPTSTTPTQTQARPEIELNPGGLSENHVDGVPNRQAEAVVSNTGDSAITNVQVRARWYNEDGHLIGDDFSNVPILPAKEKWSTWVYPHSVVVEEVADVELTASYGGLWPGSTPGIEFSEVSMREVEVASDSPQDAYRVEGLASNETGEMVDVDVVALLRRSDGVVLYASSASQGGVPAGDTWAFGMGWEVLVRWSLVDHYELFTQATRS